MDLGLADRAILITGGTSGLGLAAAKEFLAEGAKVLISSRRAEHVADATAELGGGPNVLGLAADLADPAAAERLVAMAVAAFGRLDGALISGGGPPPGQTLHLTDDAWHEAFDSTFLGVLRVVRAVAAAVGTDPSTRTGTGAAIGLVLSLSAREPIPGLSLSNGLRSGLAALIKDLGDELGPSGTRIVGLLPGWFSTERTATLDSARGNPESVRRQRESAVPLGRYGDPAEFGRMAAFMLSPAASFMTGTLITIDGGRIRGS